MGCDIHPFIEKQDKTTGKWSYIHEDKLVEDPYEKGRMKVPWELLGEDALEGRNYFLFGVLTNGQVRRDMPNTTQGDYSFLEDRGVPDDSADFIWSEFDAWDDNGAHSPGYITLSELNKICLEGTVMKEDSGVLQLFTFVRNELNKYSDETTSEVRLVFWFDN